MLTKRRRRLGIESLESRTMLAADLAGGILTVIGSDANDNIQVQVATAGPNSGDLQVDINGVQSFFTVAQVTEIVIQGLKGNDQITVDDNVTIGTTIFGGKGNDTIKGGSGSDTIHGEAGNDTIDGSFGADLIYGGIGNDTLHGGAESDHVLGDAGNDAIWGDEDNDFLGGGNGNDTIDGEEGDDSCSGGNGKDTIRGGDDNDSLFGDNGKDILWGGDDDDYMEGGNSSDDCHGEAGDDELKGGRGSDHLDGDGGSNLLDSDQGKDDLANGLPCDLDNRFEFILVGSGGASGEGRIRSQNDSGVVKTRFRLEIEDVAANTAFDLIIGGVTVGQITTDGSGEGEIRYSTHPTGNELPFPGNFPVLHEGMVIQVGSVLSGVCVNHYAFV